MTISHRNADTEPSPSSIERGASVYFPSHWTPEEARAWIDTVVPPKHKSADQRIREAFDALRAEMVSLFGEPKEPADCDDPNWPLWHCDAWIDAAQECAREVAKLPADA